MSLRQIALDTETTGIGHDQGHRLIEIGCVELVNRRLTGQHFHRYLNPQRDVDAGAFRVHGISSAFLADKPLFKDVVAEFLDFVDGAELIIHNAVFDLGFLNADLQRVSWPKALEQHCSVFDSLPYARKKHPGQRNSLDALCKRYAVNNSNRQWHGALIDAELLAHVYLAMTGGQRQLFAEEERVDSVQASSLNPLNPSLSSRSPVIYATADELVAHELFIKNILRKQN